MIDDIKKKIKNKKIIIGIIGLGYVGLPLFIRFSQKGYKVIGLDIDASKIEKLKQGTSYIKHLNFTYLNGKNSMLIIK